MAKLTVYNDISILETTNQKLLKFIFDNLRFRDMNYFSKPRYRQKAWDGFTNFFNEKNGKFLTGLLPEIIQACLAFNEKPALFDRRTNIDFIIKEINSTFLHSSTPPNTKPIDLEDYQVDFVNTAIKNKRGIIFAPTSAGKSLTMLSLLKCLPSDAKTLVLQNRTGLARQNYAEYIKWGLKNVGGLWGKFNDPNTITVATVQSIEKIDHLLKDIEVLLVDEIHDMMSKVPKSVYRKLKNCSVRIAVSATPFKYGEKDKIQKYYVKGFFGPKFKIKSTESGIITVKELQERKRLSESISTFYKIDKPDDIQDDLYPDAITNGMVENDYLHNIIKTLCEKELKGRTLIIVERLAHGDNLLKLMPNALWVQGKDNEETRQYVIEKLKKDKECIAIATQGIFNTGINVFIHNLINAAGGQAEHLITQRFGRGLRTAEDKEILRYIDFIFLTNKYLKKHSLKRVKIIKADGHEVEIKEVDEIGKINP